MQKTSVVAPPKSGATLTKLEEASAERSATRASRAKEGAGPGGRPKGTFEAVEAQAAAVNTTMKIVAASAEETASFLKKGTVTKQVKLEQGK